MNPNITVPIFGALIGVPNLVAALYFHIQYHLSKNWKPVSGIITSSNVVSIHEAGCAPKVTYSYLFESQKYFGNRIWLTYWSQPSIKLSQKFADKYPVNSAVTVYCNPNKPSSSILEYKFTVGILGCYVAGLVGIACILLPIYIDLS